MNPSPASVAGTASTAPPQGATEIPAGGEIAIKVEDLWKRYRTGQFAGKTMVKDVQSFVAGLFGREDPNAKIAIDRSDLTGGDVISNEWFWALKGISFEVKKGEVVSILGRNGAGKSTLLQVICQITEASRGTVTLNGRIASLLQAGVGFNEELTGRENVFLNGTILGLNRDEIIERIPVISEFSEIVRFLDTPVKRYSSGMVARLGFAVAAHLGADILILDEVFAVGDAPFRDKCIRRIEELAAGGTTILVVTHIPQILEGACDRAIVLAEGESVFDGDVHTGIDIYMGNSVAKEGETVSEGLVDHDAHAISNPKELVAKRPLDPLTHADAARYYRHFGLNGQAWVQFRNAVSLSDGEAGEKLKRELKSTRKRLDLDALLSYFQRQKLERIRSLVAEKIGQPDSILEIGSEGWLGEFFPKCRYLVFTDFLNGISLEQIPGLDLDYDLAIIPGYLSDLEPEKLGEFLRGILDRVKHVLISASPEHAVGVSAEVLRGHALEFFETIYDSLWFRDVRVGTRKLYTIEDIKRALAEKDIGFSVTDVRSNLLEMWVNLVHRNAIEKLDLKSARAINRYVSQSLSASPGSHEGEVGEHLILIERK